MRFIFTIPILLLLGACSDLGYYWHSANGHMALMNKRLAIEKMLADPTVDTQLAARLQRVQAIRRFSIQRLSLPDNGSYRSYVALDRPYVILNLFAAAEFSTRLHSWCYPVIGCTSYRGYYDKQRLNDYIAVLKDQGIEVYVGEVPAYSTLGWFDDPVLSSFIQWPDYRLAGLIFHELTHQKLYLDSDTEFNESLASAVEQVGTELWLQSMHLSGQLIEFRRWVNYRDEVIALVAATRIELSAIYQSGKSVAQKRELKRKAFLRMRRKHEDIARQHHIEDGFRNWFSQGLNNAKIGSLGAYTSLLPAFVHMLRANDNHFDHFFGYVGKIAEMDKVPRDACLSAWSQSSSPDDVAVCP